MPCFQMTGEGHNPVQAWISGAPVSVIWPPVVWLTPVRLIIPVGCWPVAAVSSYTVAILCMRVGSLISEALLTSDALICPAVVIVIRTKNNGTGINDSAVLLSASHLMQVTNCLLHLL